MCNQKQALRNGCHLNIGDANALIKFFHGGGCRIFELVADSDYSDSDSDSYSDSDSDKPEKVHWVSAYQVKPKDLDQMLRVSGNIDQCRERLMAIHV